MTDKEFCELISRMECIIGSKCYNGNIQNYGPGGEWDGEGREFRYPITFYDAERGKIKSKYIYYKDWDDQNKVLTGHYAFGANQLYIVRALFEIVAMLQKEYGFKV